MHQEHSRRCMPTVETPSKEMRHTGCRLKLAAMVACSVGGMARMYSPEGRLATVLCWRRRPPLYSSKRMCSGVRHASKPGHTCLL